MFLSSRRGTIGESIQQELADDRESILEELGPEARWPDDRRHAPISTTPYGDLADPSNRAEVLAWLRERLNRYINALRPRVQAIADDMDLS